MTWLNSRANANSERNQEKPALSGSGTLVSSNVTFVIVGQPLVIFLLQLFTGVL